MLALPPELLLCLLHPPQALPMCHRAPRARGARDNPPPFGRFANGSNLDEPRFATQLLARTLLQPYQMLFWFTHDCHS